MKSLIMKSNLLNFAAGKNSSVEFIHSDKHSIYVVRDSSYEIWFQDNEIHREDGPAIIYKNGSVAYCKNGKFHREDGPAVINAHGFVQYWKDGKLSNEDGPAVVYMNGEVEYWIDGVSLTSADKLMSLTDTNLN